MIQIRRDGIHNLRVDARGDEFSGDADRVADRESRGDPVADDDIPVNAQERSATGFFIVRFLADGGKGGLQEPSGDRGDGILAEFAADERDRGLQNAFHHFEDDIADESVADNAICFAGEKIASFDIADKIQGGLPEKLVGFLKNFGALGFFLSDIQKADCRAFFLENAFGENIRHERVLEEFKG